MAEVDRVQEPGARHPSVLSEDDLELHGSVGLQIKTSLRETIPNGALATFEVVRKGSGKLVACVRVSKLRIYVRAWPETEEEMVVVNSAIQKAWRLYRHLASANRVPG